MKDINLVKFSGTIFWSKLDDRQTFSILRLGVSLDQGGGVFITIQNPRTKTYDIIKPGNKIMVAGAWLDLWEKDGGYNEVQIKAYDSGVAFFTKEKSVIPMNEVVIMGKVLSYSGENATIEMIGDRNPKTNKYAIRKTIVKIGDKYSDIIDKKIFLIGKLVAIEDENKKSHLVIEADYDKISIL